MKGLIEIQNELKAPKNQYNSFGKYSYRSCEDILEGVKPLLKKYNCELHISDEIVMLGDRFYIKATATLKDSQGEEVVSYGIAREPLARKGMDEAQVTGATSSYARKYALNGLFCIDDTKDADTMDNRDNGNNQKAEMKKPEPPKKKFTDEQIELMKDWKDGTFSEEELAEFKKQSAAPGADINKLFQRYANEYDKRKEKGIPKGAEDAFDGALF